MNNRIYSCSTAKRIIQTLTCPDLIREDTIQTCSQSTTCWPRILSIKKKSDHCIRIYIRSVSMILLNLCEGLGAEQIIGGNTIIPSYMRGPKLNSDRIFSACTGDDHFHKYCDMWCYLKHYAEYVL